MSGVSTLAPDVSKRSPEYKNVRLVLNKIVRQVAHHHLGDDLLMHVYFAGLWHGTQLAERQSQTEALK